MKSQIEESKRDKCHTVARDFCPYNKSLLTGEDCISCVEVMQLREKLNIAKGDEFDEGGPVAWQAWPPIGD